MDAILDELDAVAAGTQAERQRGTAQADEARAWERFLRERGSSQTPRTTVRPWRDEEGL